MLYKKILKNIKKNNIYDYLISLGKKIKKIPNKIKKNKYLLKNCLTKVWFYVFYKNNKVYILAKSKSKIIDGLLYLIIKNYSNKTTDDILTDKNDWLKKINFSKILSINRYLGFLNIIKKIKLFALKKNRF